MAQERRPADRSLATGRATKEELSAMTVSWPKGCGLKTFDVIDSTNEEARRLAAAGEAGPIWITAARQTAGRGRRGRVWESPSGNLAATLMLRPGKPAGECAQLSFAAAIAACDTVAHFAPAVEVRVKWPNDVLADGRKICGILLESASHGTEIPSFLAIGIGINLASHPEGTEYPATSLKALGTAVPTPDDALLHLAAHFARWYEIWCADGYAPIRDAWLARAKGLGERIRARLATGETQGIFEGIDETGALILREPAGVRRIAAGEVFFA
jgi:BirA family transcriptional regulator, biotin operon repressor / biotin---[acetyl-CoA-carboxylase] ligase